jgi:hypothetical protein
LEIQLNYKNGLEGKLTWVMKNKIQKKLILKIKNFHLNFFFVPTFYFSLLLSFYYVGV